MSLKKREREVGTWGWEGLHSLIDSSSNIATAGRLAETRQAPGLPLAGRAAWKRCTRTETEGRKDVIGLSQTESENLTICESLRDSWVLLGVTPKEICLATTNLALFPRQEIENSWVKVKSAQTDEPCTSETWWQVEEKGGLFGYLSGKVLEGCLCSGLNSRAEEG